MPEYQIILGNGTLQTSKAETARLPNEFPVIDNFTPVANNSEQGVLASRNGYVKIRDIGEEIKTVINYNGAIIYCTDSGVFKCGLSKGASGIYDFTNVVKIFTVTNGRFSFTIMNSILIMCNGVQKPLKVLTNFTCTELNATPSQNSDPFDSKNFAGVSSYRGRIFFWEKNSQKIWFNLSGGSLDGNYAFLTDLQQVSNSVSNVDAIITIPKDAGIYGTRDVMDIILKDGTHIVFQGEDPANINDWTVVETYRTSNSLGERAIAKFYANTFVLGQGKLRTMDEISSSGSDVIEQDPVASIMSGEADYTQDWFSITTVPNLSLVILNIPTSSLNSTQIVLNYVAKQLTRWREVDGKIFFVHDGEIFFTKGKEVYWMGVGVDEGNVPIQTRVRTPYLNFGNLSTKKIKSVDLSMTSSVDMSEINLEIFSDYGRASKKSIGKFVSPCFTFGKPFGKSFGGTAKTRTITFNENIAGKYFSFSINVKVTNTDFALDKITINYE